MAISGPKIATCENEEWGAGFQWPRTCKSQTHRDIPLLLVVLSTQERRKQWANRACDHLMTLEFIALFLMWFLEMLSQKCPINVANCSVFLNNRWNKSYVTFFSPSPSRLFSLHHIFPPWFSTPPSSQFSSKGSAKQLPQDLCEFFTKKAIQTII